MKKHVNLFFALILLFIVGCSGSENYRGTWKALDSNNQKNDIIFDAKEFKVVNETNDTIKFSYTQNSVEINDSVTKYGINLKDGRKYVITFPKADNKNVGVILDSNDHLLYTISRTDYVEYDDIYALK